MLLRSKVYSEPKMKFELFTTSTFQTFDRKWGSRERSLLLSVLKVSIL